MKIVDVKELFNRTGIPINGKRTIEIKLNEHTYLPEGELEKGWLPQVLKGLKKLSNQDNSHIKDICIVGIGPGIEAIAVSKLFSPHRLICTDIHPEVPAIARENIIKNCDNMDNQNLVCTECNLLCYLIENNIKVDMLYENLPNIPMDAPSNEIIKVNSSTASFYSSDMLNGIPDFIESSMLGLHYQFLIQAKKCLKPGGIVICSIGGRIPYNKIKKMFLEMNFKPEILHCDMILQLAAAEVLQGYITAQKKYKNKFLFYEYEEGKKMLSKAMETSKTIEDALEDESLKNSTIGFDAANAYFKLFSGNTEIGHTGLIIKGNMI